MIVTVKGARTTYKLEVERGGKRSEGRQEVRTWL
jgi:hypothetical protein